MYFPADPASLHSFPPCLLYQQRGGLVIVPVPKYRLLIIRFFTGIFGRSIGTLTVRRYRCGPLLLGLLAPPCNTSGTSHTPQLPLGLSITYLVYFIFHTWFMYLVLLLSDKHLVFLKSKSDLFKCSVIF